MRTVPENITTAINAMLAPYGVTFDPNNTQPPAPRKDTSGGCMTTKEAMKYLGMSHAYFWRQVRNGRLKLIHNTDKPRGKRTVSIAAMEEYIANCKAE
jgi:hypothetical protein